MSDKVARVAAIASVIPDHKANALQVGLVTEDETTLRLEIPEAVLGPLVLGLTAKTPELSGSGASQAMVLTRAEVVDLIGGGPALRLLLENGRLPLLVQIPTGKSRLLRDLADELSDRERRHRQAH